MRPGPKNRLAFIGLLIVFLIVILVFRLTPTSAVAKAPAPKAKVVLEEVKSVDDVRRFIYPARIEAKINSTITADLDGHVLRLLKTLGASVRAGEIVLYIENRDPAFTYSAVPVRSPITGIISQLNLQLMSKVAKGEKLFTVMDADAVHINAEIPSSDIAFLHSGTVGKFQTAGSISSYDIRIVGLSPIVDPRSGTATAEIEFTAPPQLNKELVEKKNAKVATSTIKTPPVGSVGQISFQISSGSIILLPENSLSYVDGKPTVRVVDAENRTHRRPIELGEQREDLFVVKSGVKPGEKVVVRANRSLKDGEEIENSSNDQGTN